MVARLACSDAGILPPAGDHKGSPLLASSALCSIIAELKKEKNICVCNYSRKCAEK